jgi:hypothetical protein
LLAGFDGVRGDRDDGRRDLLLAQDPACLEPIQFGHVYVHENRVVCFAGRALHRLAPGLGNVHPCPGALQELQGQLLVDGVVLRDQELSAI